MAKRNNSLMDFLGPVLGGFGGDILGPMAGLSPGLGGALGGALGGELTGGPMDALAGAAGGYGLGASGINSMFGNLLGNANGTAASGIVPGAPDATGAILAQSTPAVAGGDVSPLSTLANSSLGAGGGDVGSIVGGASPVTGTSATDPFGLNSIPLAGGGAAGSDVLNAALAGAPAASAFGGGSTLDTLLASPQAQIAAGGAAAQPSFASQAENFFKSPKNDLMLALLGGSILKGNQQPGEIGQLKSLASSQLGMGKTLGNLALGEMQGNLPAGAQAFIDQQAQAAKAQIRSTYASMGMSGSSAEAQDLAGVDNNALAMRFKIGQEMASTGLTALQGMDNSAGSLYQDILAAETQQGSALGNALAMYAAALTR